MTADTFRCVVDIGVGFAVVNVVNAVVCAAEVGVVCTTGAWAAAVGTHVVAWATLVGSPVVVWATLIGACIVVWATAVGA